MASNYRLSYSGRVEIQTLISEVGGKCKIVPLMEIIRHSFSSIRLKKAIRRCEFARATPVELNKLPLIVKSQRTIWSSKSHLKTYMFRYIYPAPEISAPSSSWIDLPVYNHLFPLAVHRNLKVLRFHLPQAVRNLVSTTVCNCSLSYHLCGSSVSFQSDSLCFCLFLCLQSYSLLYFCCSFMVFFSVRILLQ